MSKKSSKHEDPRERQQRDAKRSTRAKKKSIERRQQRAMKHRRVA